MRREKVKLRGMDRILMSMDPSHKYNEITKSIDDPLDVLKRACAYTLEHIENGTCSLQKANFGRTLDLIWLSQGIVEDLLVHLVDGKPGINNWLSAINKAQEETMRLKGMPKNKLKNIWSSRAIKHKHFLAEQKICKDLNVSTIKEAKKVLDRDYETKVINGFQEVVKKELY
tara:strand:- start:13 stop:528 length:516 start_codon:yes stop_codon:yes gene_type:complete